MIKHLHADELLNSKEFVREPVNNVNKKIDSMDSKRIILTGGRGSGKSTVLHNKERNAICSENPFIYTHFDSIGVFQLTADEVFNEVFFNHYYELIFCKKILNYIKTNYSLTYETNFKEFEKIIKNVSTKTDTYIHNSFFEKVTLNTYLMPTEVSSIIIEKLKKSLHVDSISLGIDRFDWTNSNDDLSQIILSKFFDLFDKTIITTDDDELQDKDNRTQLIENGYSFIDVDYGHDILVIKQIIKNRISEYNQTLNNDEKIFPIDAITDVIYQHLINKLNGNISLILQTINEVIIDWQFKEGFMGLEKQIDMETTYQINKIKELKKMNVKQPKLYL